MTGKYLIVLSHRAAMRPNQIHQLVRIQAGWTITDTAATDYGHDLSLTVEGDASLPHPISLDPACKVYGHKDGLPVVVSHKG